MTAFLNSGDKVHPILSKSRSWCVDGKTKLVLRIRPNTYYRFELPNTCPEDLRIADDLKRVFKLVSQYETTQCPFMRDFTVELPATPKTPIQKRPWKPKHQPTRLPGERKQASHMTPEPVSDESSTESIEEENAGQSLKEILSLEQQHTNEDQTIPEALKTPTRPKSFSGGRAVTAPPQLTLRPAPSSSTEDSVFKRSDQDVETASLSSSVDSFYSLHSFHSPISPLPPSPPCSEPPSPLPKQEAGLGIDVPRTRQHKRDASELTVTAETFPGLDIMETPSWPQNSAPSTPVLPETPALTNDAVSPSDDSWPEVITPSSQASLRHRPYASRRRTHSPLPSSTNLYSPRTRMSGHHLTTALLQKTCALLLGPPVQLVALMLNIAARIANGTYGKSYTSKEGRRSIPCTWEYSDAEDEGRDLWDEDDYGISLGVLSTPKMNDAQGTGESWEID